MDGAQREAPAQGAGLTNADFRKLLDTPRLGRSRETTVKEKKQPLKQHGKAVRPQGGPAEEEFKDQGDVSIYRDRAEERRRGVVDGSTSHLSDRDVASLSIEESKYFGGDEEHTHLVRGLDYALLSKVRAEREQRQREEEERRMKEVVAIEKASKVPFKTVEEEKVPSHSALGRSILRALGQVMNHRTRSKTDMFVPRRTGFAFSMTSSDKFEMPMVRMRALEEAPHRPACVESASLPKEVFDEIVSIMQYAKDGRPKPRKEEPVMHERVRGGEAPRAELKEDDDEDDIFGDVGSDYTPERRTGMEKKTSAKPVGSYFSDTLRREGGDGTSPAATLAGTPQQWHVGRQRAPRRQEIDGYEECYPLEAGGVMDESDDDEGPAKPGKEEPQPDKRKDATREKAKLDHELNKIQKIFDDKGYEHAAAFGGTSLKKGSGKATADESFEPILKKKRRI